MSGRALKAMVACGGAVLAVGILGAGTAAAAFLTPEYSTTFAGAGTHSVGHAVSVAVDEQTHDVYVGDSEYHRIEKFSADGTFLLMFGYKVDETNQGNVCPVEPTDVCRQGQPDAPSTFPELGNPSSIAVDNSDDAAKGSVFVAEGINNGGDSAIWKFTSDGQQDPGWGTNGSVVDPQLEKMGISPFDGTIWVLDSDVADVPGGTAGSRIVSYDPVTGLRGFRKPQSAGSGGDGNLAVDSESDLWWGPFPIKVDPERLSPPYGGGLGSFSPGQASGFAVDSTDSDVLAIFNEEEIKVFERSCEPLRGFCAPKESFGNGHLTEPRALAYDGTSGSAFVAGGSGVVVFDSLKVPDVTVKTPGTHPADAVLAAAVDPIGAGPIQSCQVEFGTTTSYGTNIPCEQALPIASAGDVTVHPSGLTTEAVYHYRFRVGNSNGTNVGSDQILVPRWVTGLETGDASDVGPGSATLHGRFDPEGAATSYHFEWGTTTAYGHLTSDLPAPTSAPGLTSVEATIAGELTSSTTYHYRLVGTNAGGTSYGFDREFTTPLSDPPQLRNPRATATSGTAVTISAELNPGFGLTQTKVQYGPTSAYGGQTIVGDPVAEDGEFGTTSVALTGLVPGATYHYRMIAFNFVGHVVTDDGVFTMPEQPTIQGVSSEVTGPHSVRVVAEVGDGLWGPAGVGVEYGTGAGYGSQAPAVQVNGQGALATVLLSGLSAATTYHFRVSAANGLGRVLSTDQIVTTAPEPSARPVPEGKGCRKGFVRRKKRCVKKKHSKKPSARGVNR